MDNFFNYANHLVLYTVCYAFFFAIYGYIFYHIGKFIVRVLTAAYKRVKADWKAWRSGKDNQ